ncbi:phage protein [Bowmanella denitrificans]|uniref:phage protein n=1 Tax=Bowmanella denitrificans TaxID=366582 RepID=UPI000C9C6834|nr:phage protein [Bowmanella denitrificans]
MKHISGKDFDVMIGDLLVHVESATLNITDERTTVKTGGVPNGYVDGDVSAEGEIELDTTNFLIVNEAAKNAGSWKGLPPFDVNFTAAGSETKMNVEAFGCLLKISDLLNIDPNGKEKKKHKLPYVVTDKNFVNINGVPYLAPAEIEDIV